tara:strand:+ start:202 stop:480 length:279 start_codon:yes stop_codon:yes gene_type:complete
MKRFTKNYNFWEITYIDDINEIIIRYGNNDTNELTIMSGHDGNEWEMIIENEVKSKIDNNWSNDDKNIMNKKDLIDIRLNLYNYDGTKKIQN